MLLNPRWLRPLLAVAGGAAAVWVLLRILQQQEIAPMVLWGAGCALYVGWLVFLVRWPGRCVDASRERRSRTGLAQVVPPCSAPPPCSASSAWRWGRRQALTLLVQMLTNSSLPCGRSYTLPLSLIAGLSGCLAVLTAQLPWYALPVLAVIPVAALIPLPAKQRCGYNPCCCPPSPWRARQVRCI